MSKVTVHAGDFLKGPSSFMLGSFSFTTKEHYIIGETISGKEIDTIEIATEENVKKLAGTVGWGIAGGLLLGPTGLLAGLLLGGKKEEVTFVLKFKDGRKFLGTTDKKTFIGIQAAAF